MLPYSEKEIVEMYRRAECKSQQIRILAELNLTGNREIIEVLEKHNVDLSDIEAEKLKQSKTISRADWVACEYRAMAARGYTVAEAAKAMGRGKDTVRAYALRNGIKFKSAEMGRPPLKQSQKRSTEKK